MNIWSGGLPRRGQGRGRAQIWAAAAALALLGGCGVGYNTSVVDDRDRDLPVNVIYLDGPSIAEANRSPYTPRSLPDVFYRVAGSGSGVRGAGALPQAPFVPTERQRALATVPLPRIGAPPYRIGVGDVVLVSTRGAANTVEQLSGLLAAQNSRQGYTVRDDGAIAIPEVGTIPIGGLTLEEAEDALFQVLVENQIDPSFSLEIAEFNSKRVTVGRAVNGARIVPITMTPLTLNDALVSAGGLAVADEEFASVRIYRDGSLYQIPVEAYLNDPNLQQAVLVDEDAVFVDVTYDLDRALEFYQQQIDVIALRSRARSDALNELSTEINLQRQALEERRRVFEARAAFDAEDRDYVYLAGEVNTQARIPLPFGRQASLADVLFDGGGFDIATADPTEIYILRAPRDLSETKVTAYHLNTYNAAALVLATRMQMRPNDVIFIEDQLITRWNRAIVGALPVAIGRAVPSN
jgi:polysaccharide export outer membrane protein